VDLAGAAVPGAGDDGAQSAVAHLEALPQDPVEAVADDRGSALAFGDGELLDGCGHDLIVARLAAVCKELLTASHRPALLRREGLESGGRGEERVVTEALTGARRPCASCA
jgi:hypothetical protein